MTARKAARRPQARKAKLIEVIDGVKLTVAQHAEYLRRLEEVRRLCPKWQTWEHERRALSNCRYQWRPSVKAQERFKTMDLYKRVRDALLSLGTLDDFPLSLPDTAVVRIGNELIQHVADELGAVAGELRTIHAAIAQETAS